MTRRSLAAALAIGVAIVAIGVWVANNTYWVDLKVSEPLRGEARSNPFYAAQRFADALGARTSSGHFFTLPRADSVVVLSSWHWALNSGRQNAIERWVEHGGQLVVDSTLIGGGHELERWSGIARNARDFHEDEPFDNCRSVEEAGGRIAGRTGGNGLSFSMCDVQVRSSLASVKPILWSLKDAKSGIQAMRVGVGKGTVTIINGDTFRYRSLLAGDHGSILVAATQLHSGGTITFLSEEDIPSLVALAWRYGAPAVVLVLSLCTVVLWRNSARFGPLALPRETARRSLAEQIVGTGRFALKHGGADVLHAASARALQEAAARRVHGYPRLSLDERVAALERLTGVDRHVLAAGLSHPRGRDSRELRNTLWHLEDARRRVLHAPTRSPHGT